VDAHRDDGKRFVARADEKLTAFLELESAIRVALALQVYLENITLPFVDLSCFHFGKPLFLASRSRIHYPKFFCTDMFAKSNAVLLPGFLMIPAPNQYSLAIRQHLGNFAPIDFFKIDSKRRAEFSNVLG